LHFVIYLFVNNLLLDCFDDLECSLTVVLICCMDLPFSLSFCVNPSDEILSLALARGLCLSWLTSVKAESCHLVVL